MNSIEHPYTKCCFSNMISMMAIYCVSMIVQFRYSVSMMVHKDIVFQIETEKKFVWLVFPSFLPLNLLWIVV